MEFGLSENTTNILRKFFTKYPEIEEVKIYGSRAKGNYRKGSDIDFAILGDIDYNLLKKIIIKIEDLPLPYKFDVTIYNLISHLPLKEHIDNHAKTFYKRKIN